MPKDKKKLTEEEKKRRAERFTWKEGDLNWIIPPGQKKPESPDRKDDK